MTEVSQPFLTFLANAGVFATGLCGSRSHVGHWEDVRRRAAVGVRVARQQTLHKV